MMNCGYRCTCIKHAGKLVDVQFEDGSVVVDRYRSEFVGGAIRHPRLGRAATGGVDSMAQRVIYYYISKYYKNVGYNVRPDFLSGGSRNGSCFELDIYIPEIGIAIEFDGAVQSHFDEEHCKLKRMLIENSSQISKLFVIRDRDPRIVVLQSPKTTNIVLEQVSSGRLYDVYDATKIVLSDLGNDVSNLEWEPDALERLANM